MRAGQPHDLVIEPERRCVRLLLEGTEVYYDKCLIANSGEEEADDCVVDGPAGVENMLCCYLTRAGSGSCVVTGMQYGRGPLLLLSH